MPFRTIFIDLDETVYTTSCGLWQAIRERINLYMFERMHMSWDEIPTLRYELYRTYGTTMRGLIALYGIDENEYLDFVHDVPLPRYISPDPELRQALLSFPQRRVIFTNSDRNHAERVLGALEIRPCFERIIDILDMKPYCKPQLEAFEIALKQAGETDPRQAVLVDDSLANLAAARALGLYTIRAGNDEPGEYDAAILSLHQLPAALGALAR